MRRHLEVLIVYTSVWRSRHFHFLYFCLALVAILSLFCLANFAITTPSRWKRLAFAPFSFSLFLSGDPSPLLHLLGGSVWRSTPFYALLA